jgi:murein L,D-transpeptidase YcbB/YkuD
MGAELLGEFEALLQPILERKISEILQPTSLEIVFSSPDYSAAWNHERNRSVAYHLYSKREYEPVFVLDHQLTESGEITASLLSQAYRHGLLNNDYNTEEITRARAYLENSPDPLTVAQGLQLSANDTYSLLEYVSSDSALLEMAPEAFTEALLSHLLEMTTEETIAPEFSQSLQQLFTTTNALNEHAEHLELALTNGFLSYAYDMRFFNPVWFDPEVKDDEDLLDLATSSALTATFKAATIAGFETVFESLLPPHPQYALLVESLERYRNFASEGGWPPVVSGRLRLDRETEAVTPLRRRLALEGYLPEDNESPLFDRELRNALKSYQTAHQFRENGELSDELILSFNVPASERVAQIYLTLQRWRESQIADDEYYIFANISDFHLEIWKQGVLELRLRTIVGSTRFYVDGETGETVYYRQTPEIHRPLRTIVFNPYWNVPPSIMRREYDGHLEEDPLWYENNGFEVRLNERGRRSVHQLPGPGNALGQVKFMFYNDLNIYIHDTPRRSLFNRSLRAYSHGCVRVDDALTMAEYLLHEDRRWDMDDIEEILETGEQYEIGLRRHVPVHIEYYVVRVDEEGHANFLADIYRLDRPRRAHYWGRELAENILSQSLQMTSGTNLIMPLPLHSLEIQRSCALEFCL